MKTIAILVFDDLEELDAVGPYEVLAAAAAARPEDLRVVLVAETERPIRCAKGMTIVPQYSFATAPRADILVVPGGTGSRAQEKNATLIDWVRETARGCERVTSVCTGVRITLAAGIASGKRITTHWSAIEEMRARGQAAEVIEGVRFVVDGEYVSAAGVSAGIDMALWLVGQIVSPSFARDVQRQIQYDPAPPYAYDEAT